MIASSPSSARAVGDRAVVLAQVHAVGADGRGERGVVVDDEAERPRRGTARAARAPAAGAAAPVARLLRYCRHAACGEQRLRSAPAGVRRRVRPV